MAEPRPVTPVSRRLLFVAGVGTALAAALACHLRARPVRDGAAILTPPTQPPQPVDLSLDPPADEPAFSDVAQVEPWDALLFLAGRHPRYPGATIDSLTGFSPADILETMDTVVLDTIRANQGETTLAAVYEIIATELLEALLAVYGDAPVLLALDAGHGGNPDVHYDPGANGTEAIHTRAVVDAVEARATEPRYAGITIRRIFNDAIGDDLGLPPPEDHNTPASLTLRNARAAMLAHEVATWNEASPESSVALHVLSVHFNAGTGGTLVLHQGDTVPDAFRERSVAYARAYLGSARPALNDSGLLPSELGLPLGTGLSDDRVLYEPIERIPSRFNPYTGADRTSFPRRYATLQASLLQRDYALGALIYHGLA